MVDGVNVGDHIRIWRKPDWTEAKNSDGPMTQFDGAVTEINDLDDGTRQHTVAYAEDAVLPAREYTHNLEKLHFLILSSRSDDGTTSAPPDDGGVAAATPLLEGSRASDDGAATIVAPSIAHY